MAERREIAAPTPRTAAGIAGRVVSEQLRELRAHVRAARRGRDPEAVHKMRVATRRMRAVLRVFRDGLVVPRALPRRLRWIARALGAVRDRDVIADLLGQHQVAAVRGAEARRLGRLLKRLARERRRKQKRLVAALERRRWTLLLAQLRAFGRAPDARGRSDDSAVRTLTAAADRLAGEVAAHRGMTEPGPDAAALHELRIAFKRLRYVLEVHAACGAVAYAVELTLARQMQDVLGVIHDHDIVLQRLARSRGVFAGPWPVLRARLARSRQRHVRSFLRLRQAWTERTAPATGGVAPLEPPRFVNLDPQPVTLRLVVGGRQIASRRIT